MASARVSIRLPKDIHNQLRAVVRATGKSESEVVRAALSEYCRHQDREPTCYEVAKKAGFLGCTQGGPDDLSVNRKYMRGFGRE
jgi:Arc/MetJ-type ribon-helix-helix transcriptional regulator